MKFKLVLSFVFLFFIAGLSSDVSTQEDIDNELAYVQEQGDEGSINWTKQVLRIKGNGFGPERVKSLGRRKILAKRAAKLDAYRNLIEVIKGVHITSSTSVEDMMLESDLIKSKTEGMLKGMKTVNVTYSNDGGCEITVEVNIDKNGGFLLSALNSGDVKVVDNYPKFDWVALRNRVESTEKELAAVKEKLSGTRNKLYAVNKNLERIREKLQAANISNAELKLSLTETKNELTKTSYAIDELKDKLNDKELKLAVNKKELSITKDYLSEKKLELTKMFAELKNYSENYEKTSLSNATLLGYVKRIKEVQNQANFKMNSLYSSENLLYSSSNNSYTGLLIDVRSLNIKPVLAPSILDENRSKIYGIGVIPEEMTGGSIVDYIAGDLNKAKMYSKIGNSPLVVKGLKIIDRSNIMISNQDTAKISSIIELLKQKKVAILL